MTPQGYPLFLTERGSGAIWAIIGWRWTDGQLQAVCVLHTALWADADRPMTSQMFLLDDEFRLDVDHRTLHGWADKH